MRRMRPACLAALLLLCSCAPLRPALPGAGRCESLPLDGASIAEPLWTPFRLTVSNGSQGEESFTMQAEAEPGRLVIVGLTPLGNRGLLVERGIFGLNVEQHPLWSGPPGLLVLTAVQMVAWPSPALAEAAALCGGLFTERSAGHPVREIDFGVERLRVDYLRGREGAVLAVFSNSSGEEIVLEGLPSGMAQKS